MVAITIAVFPITFIVGTCGLKQIEKTRKQGLETLQRRHWLAKTKSFLLLLKKALTGSEAEADTCQILNRVSYMDTSAHYMD